MIDKAKHPYSVKHLATLEKKILQSKGLGLNPPVKTWNFWVFLLRELKERWVEKFCFYTELLLMAAHCQ